MLIDKLAYKSKLKNENPLIKVLFAFACIAICIWADSFAVSGVILIMMLSIIVFAGGTEFNKVLHLLTVPVSFILIGAAAIAVSVNGADMLLSFRIFGVSAGVSRSGLLAAAKVTAKCMGSVSCMYFLSLSTPMTELFGLFRKSIIPDFIVDITELVYRYIFVLYDAADRIHTSQASRLGYANLRNSYRSTGFLAANLFMRAYRQADATYTSMESRCYDGRINLAEDEYTLKPSVCIAAAAVTAALTALAIICKRYGI